MSSSTARFAPAALAAFLLIENSHAFARVSSSHSLQSAGSDHRQPAPNANNGNNAIAAAQIFASTHPMLRPEETSTSMYATSMDIDDDEGEWISLIDAKDDKDVSPVRKQIVEEGTGDVVTKGCTIELEYTGTLLGEKSWSTNDVVDCWLSQLQGLDQLSSKFIEHDINGSKLMDAAYFTEDYCMETLGIANKIQAKKLIMASKRISKQQEDYAPGSEFDSSISRGKNYSFVLGAGKVIKAMDLAVGTMKVGERARLVCRADYGYGSEGLRTSKGDVMVPPFATLCFDLKLVSAS